MANTISILETDFRVLESHLFKEPELERLAYLLCGTSTTSTELRLLVREVHCVDDTLLLSQSPKHVSVGSAEYTKWLKMADDRQLSLVLVHSHPRGPVNFSVQDDLEEPLFHRTAEIRAPSKLHGSLVLSPKSVRGRLWRNGSFENVDRVRVLGDRFPFNDDHSESFSTSKIHDRQVRAFGKDTQRVLSALHIGVVGAGGIGSCVIEQLVRLGVGTLSVWDQDDLKLSNVNRVYGSRVNDAWLQKTEIVRREIARIGLGTRLYTYNRNIISREAAERLRDCDLVFSCTDDHYGRSILNRLSLWYLIPVIDSAVEIDSTSGVIRSVIGRVTTLLPGSACLRCRGRIDQRMIDAESIAATNPVEYARLRKQGYVAELGEIAPAVIPFTTSIAAFAVVELLNRLTGFSGESVSESLHLFHEFEVRTNRRQPTENCFCSGPRYWGKGDSELYLGVLWPN